MLFFIVPLLVWAIGATFIAVRQEFRLDEMTEAVSEARQRLQQLSAEHSRCAELHTDRLRELRLEHRARIEKIENALTEPIE